MIFSSTFAQIRHGVQWFEEKGYWGRRPFSSYRLFFIKVKDKAWGRGDATGWHQTIIISVRVPFGARLMYDCLQRSNILYKAWKGVTNLLLSSVWHFFDFMFQLNAPFLYYIYHIPLHVSSNFMLFIRRIHCIHAASGSLYVTLLRWPLSAQAVRGLASLLTACALSGHLRRVTYKEPDAVCIQWILLRMSMKLLETCRGMW